MGEGWSDYFACTVARAEAIGAWAFDKPDGLRGVRYTSNFPVQSINFGSLGKSGFTDIHTIGVIWCAALLEINRRIGAPLAMRLVFDALKHSTSNPSFLDMRQFILITLDEMRTANILSQTEHLNAKREIWRTFANFGMGPLAKSDGPSLTGIAPDFQTPPDV